MPKGMILVVDDSATVRHQVRVCLQQAGHTVIEADNGAVGLMKAKEHPIDMAIIDVNMPVMDGLEMLASLRTIPDKKHVPVFVLTTESSKDLVARAKKNGAEAWIVKPFKPDALARGVAHMLALAA